MPRRPMRHLRSVHQQHGDCKREDLVDQELLSQRRQTELHEEGGANELLGAGREATMALRTPADNADVTEAVGHPGAAAGHSVRENGRRLQVLRAGRQGWDGALATTVVADREGLSITAE